MELKQNIKNAVHTSLIDKSINSIERLRPDFVYNDHSKGMKVLNTIINELEQCTEFIISAAFITNSGLTILLNTLKNLETRGINGKILTSDYLNFNEASALRRLKQFTNLEVKVCSDQNFHSKGYIFKNNNKYSLLIGSSNLTQNALTINNEWNIKLVSLPEGKLVDDIIGEFNKVWEATPTLTDDWLDKYEESHLENYQNVLKSVFENINLSREIIPNKMQMEALDAIAAQREAGVDKTLLISATGTGKTYLAAFDVKRFKPKKMLFVIHREQIAREAKRSFERVIGKEKNFKGAILSGNNRDIEDADYIFSTIQTLSKNDILTSLPKDYFDYICIDEVHRAGAASYTKIINYFEPKFLLGMSATPERTDGYNIYELFDYNIAYEIRLQHALAEKMLCPFHYFGVTELTVNGVEITEEADFRHLTSEERVNHIIEKVNFYGYSGPRVRGLIFCSSKMESNELSKKFNERGFQTISLTGENTQEEREDAIRRLELPYRSFDALDYIFTVDIFNEGVDIPKINQVVMLRPTESAIIFVQQLGRGLRLDPEKEYLVVIDFIANYKKNFLIPVALSGNKTYNKDFMRRFVSNRTSVIPGATTIHFDEISKQKIFESINKTNFSVLRFIKTEYVDLKNKINKIPSLVDFYKYGSIDPELIFNHSKSYYNFLSRIKENVKVFSTNEISILNYITKEVANSKRIHEILILKELLENETTFLLQLDKLIKTNYNSSSKLDDLMSAISVLNSDFQTSQNKLSIPLVHLENDRIKFNDNLKDLLKDDVFRWFIEDLIEYSLLKYTNEYIDNEQESNFVLYQKYTRKEVVRLLNWETDESSTVYGYRIKYNTCPIFVTYHKSDDISETTKYEDEFVDHYIFSWMTRSRLTIESTEVQQIINSKKNGLKLYLFIKKNDDEGSEFYYMGQVETIDEMWEQVTIKDKNNNEIPIVRFYFKMLNPVKHDIYDYFTKGEKYEENN